MRLGDFARNRETQARAWHQMLSSPSPVEPVENALPVFRSDRRSPIVHGNDDLVRYQAGFDSDLRTRCRILERVIHKLQKRNLNQLTIAADACILNGEVKIDLMTLKTRREAFQSSMNETRDAALLANDRYVGLIQTRGLQKAGCQIGEVGRFAVD